MKPSRDTLRQIVVAASAVIAIVGSFIGSGAAGGTPIQDAAGGALSATATPLAPAAPAFSIWSVIYLGLVAYAIWQALPKQRESERQRRLGYWIAASLFLNAAWILSIQLDALPASLPIIAALLVVLLRVFFLCLASRPSSRLEAILVDGTMGLYLGWVCVATAANIAALLVAVGFRGFGASAHVGTNAEVGANTNFGANPDVWAVAIIAVVGVLGVLLAIRDRGRIAPMLSLVWGLAWLAVGRLTGALHSTPAGIAALVAAAAILLVTLAALTARLTRRTRTPTTTP